MTLDTLATARDVAVLILFVQVFAILAAILAVAYLAQRGLRRLVRRAGPPLARGRDAVLNAMDVARRVTVRVGAPFASLQGAWAGLRAGLGSLRRRLGEGRSSWKTT